MFGQSFCFVCFSLLARPYCRLGANRSAPSVFFDWAGCSTQAHTRTRAKTERIRKRGAPPIRRIHPQASQAHTPASKPSAHRAIQHAVSRSRQIKIARTLSQQANQTVRTLPIKRRYTRTRTQAKSSNPTGQRTKTGDSRPRPTRKGKKNKAMDLPPPFARTFALDTAVTPIRSLTSPSNELEKTKKRHMYRPPALEKKAWHLDHHHTHSPPGALAQSVAEVLTP